MEKGEEEGRKEEVFLKGEYEKRGREGRRKGRVKRR